MAGGFFHDGAAHRRASRKEDGVKACSKAHAKEYLEQMVSGTGNSQRTAKQIAVKLDDKIISSNQYLKMGEKNTFHAK